MHVAEPRPPLFLGDATLLRRRTRTLLGTVGILLFVVIYAPLAMAIADSRIAQTPPLVQAVIYSVLGIAWIFPLMPLIRWMEIPDKPR